LAHLTGLILIDAPASALNNAGNVAGERTDNKVAVKQIIKGFKSYPYVSAQAFRYWLRTTLETNEDIEWNNAPIYRETKIAYTDSNPLKYWDDDLFGYMRAQSKKTGAKKENDPTRDNETITTTTITRVSPFRVSTLVAIAPSKVDDFGVMARHEGDPVPHEHQFYSATLKGLLSLDLRSSGTFWASQKTGFKNLDEARIAEADEMELVKEEVDRLEAYRLSDEERAKRISSLVKAIAYLEGGAKQALHYTDVTPSFLLFAVTRGGNHIFHRVIEADSGGSPILHLEALEEVLTVYSDQILSPLFIGWPKGYMDKQRQEVIDLLNRLKDEKVLSDYVLNHPRQVTFELAAMFQNENNFNWLR
jgi:CRISPR-associated protein Cst2